MTRPLCGTASAVDHILQHQSSEPDAARMRRFGEPVGTKRKGNAQPGLRRILVDCGFGAYIHTVSPETMAINAHVINGSDPGAVPGGSTKTPRSFGGQWGRNRIDGRLKVLAFAR